ncbi:MAG: hypothetical protein NVSMB2_22550 [Chloroflexota bacterium]
MSGIVGKLTRGVIAGSLGTLAMDLLWYARYRQGGGNQSFVDWEFSVGLDSWDKASAPAKVGKLLYERIFGHELSADYAAMSNNIMHWTYGTSWAGVLGLIAGTASWRPIVLGVPFGAYVWGMSYLILPRLGLYKPIWEYDLPTLWQDLSAHLTFGVTTGLALRVVSQKG